MKRPHLPSMTWPSAVVIIVVVFLLGEVLAPDAMARLYVGLGRLLAPIGELFDGVTFWSGGDGE